jgi:hypothetical protein
MLTLTGNNNGTGQKKKLFPRKENIAERLRENYRGK